VIRPPAALLECAPAPGLPADGELAAMTDQQVLDRLLFLVVDLWEAHADCEGKVAALRTWAAGRPGR
jgi:hypothetical protein